MVATKSWGRRWCLPRSWWTHRLTHYWLAHHWLTHRRTHRSVLCWGYWRHVRHLHRIIRCRGVSLGVFVWIFVTALTNSAYYDSKQNRDANRQTKYKSKFCLIKITLVLIIFFRQNVAGGTSLRVVANVTVLSTSLAVDCTCCLKNRFACCLSTCWRIRIEEPFLTRCAVSLNIIAVRTSIHRTSLTSGPTQISSTVCFARLANRVHTHRAF